MATPSSRHVSAVAAGALTNAAVTGWDSADVPPTFHIEWATGAFTGVGPYEVTATSGVFVAVDSGAGPVDAVQCQVIVTDHDAATRSLAGRGGTGARAP